MGNPIRMASRALLATVFIGGGINQLKNPGGFPAEATEKALTTYGLANSGLPAPKTLVTINGVGMVGAGAALALGVQPRLAALALAGLLLPTNIAGHPFWEMTDPMQKFQQRNEFMSNLAIIGGLLAVATNKN